MTACEFQLATSNVTVNFVSGTIIFNQFFVISQLDEFHKFWPGVFDQVYVCMLWIVDLISFISSKMITNEKNLDAVL